MTTAISSVFFWIYDWVGLTSVILLFVMPVLNISLGKVHFRKRSYEDWTRCVLNTPLAIFMYGMLDGVFDRLPLMHLSLVAGSSSSFSVHTHRRLEGNIVTLIYATSVPLANLMHVDGKWAWPGVDDRGCGCERYVVQFKGQPFSFALANWSFKTS